MIALLLAVLVHLGQSIYLSSYLQMEAGVIQAGHQQERRDKIHELEHHRIFDHTLVIDLVIISEYILENDSPVGVLHHVC